MTIPPSNKVTGDPGHVADHNSITGELSLLANRTITAGTGLTGGGNLTANRTIAVDIEWLQDTLSNIIVAGANITATYNDTTGTITIASAGTGGGGGMTTEEIQDLLASTLTAGTGITLNYDDVAGTITINAAAAANMAQATIKGRAAGAGTGAPTDLTVAQVAAILGGTTASTLALGNHIHTGGTYEAIGTAAGLISTHHSPSSTDHDDRYYTETEIDSLLVTKADVGHTHAGGGPSGFVDTFEDIFVDGDGTSGGGGTGGGVTIEQQAILDAAEDHITDTNNPHAVTLAQIGAAPTAHSHGAGTFAWPAEWQPGTPYTVGDVVAKDGTLYRLDSPQVNNGMLTKVDIVGSYSDEDIVSTVDYTRLGQLRDGDKLLACVFSTGFIVTVPASNVATKINEAFVTNASNTTITTWFYADIPNAASPPAVGITTARPRVTWVVVRGATVGAPTVLTNTTGASKSITSYVGSSAPATGHMVIAGVHGSSANDLPFYFGIQKNTKEQSVEGQSGVLLSRREVVAGVVARRENYLATAFASDVVPAEGFEINSNGSCPLLLTASSNSYPFFDRSKWTRLGNGVDRSGDTARLVDVISASGSQLNLIEKTTIVGELNYGVLGTMGSAASFNSWNVLNIILPDPAIESQETWTRFVLKNPAYPFPRGTAFSVVSGSNPLSPLKVAEPAAFPGAINEATYVWNPMSRSWYLESVGGDTTLTDYVLFRTRITDPFPYQIFINEKSSAFGAGAQFDQNVFVQTSNLLNDNIPAKTLEHIHRVTGGRFGMFLGHADLQRRFNLFDQHVWGGDWDAGDMNNRNGWFYTIGDLWSTELDGSQIHETGHMLDYAYTAYATKPQSVRIAGVTQTVSYLHDHSGFVSLHNRLKLVGGIPYYHSLAEGFAECWATAIRVRAGLLTPGTPTAGKPDYENDLLGNYETLDPTLLDDVMSVMTDLELIKP